MSSDEVEFRLEAENIDLRQLLATAGIAAAEQEVARKLQRVLLEELHHRVKNTLTTVQAIASMSLRAAQNVEEGRRAIESRLNALGRAHDLLLQTTWTTAKIEAVLSAAIEPFNASRDGRFLLRASDIDVTPNAVLPLALVLNELCTNAVKYGALSGTAGCVEIDASLDDAGENFLLVWAEKNGPVVGEPSRRSFGSTLIEHAFVAQLKGKARLEFDPAGVRYRLEAPLAAMQARISS